jgi:hypothetical protein
MNDNDEDGDDNDSQAIPSQISMVTTILGAFPKDYIATNKLINTICRCATEIVTEAGRPYVPAKPAMGLTAWLASDDTGLSSKYMASVLADSPFSARVNNPWDGADFGRCYRLLRAVPELLRNFDRLATCPAPWPALHANWTELEHIYEDALAETWKHDGPNPKNNAFRIALNKCIGR